MRGSPGSPALVGVPLTQQQGFQLLSRSQAGRTDILALARQIADRFIALIGNDYSHEIASARLPREHQRIAPVGSSRAARSENA